MNCVYLKNTESNKTTPDGRPVYDCHIHEKCTLDGDPFPFASCVSCKDRLLPDADMAGFKDQLDVRDRHGVKTHALRNLLAGRPAFLVCGGPSAQSLPLEQLSRRGIWSFAVNNMAGYCRFRPNAFVCSDPPEKFHDGIWKDPSIMKFVPTPKLTGRRGKLRKKAGEHFEYLELTTKDCPNVWGFGRRGWLLPDHTFFTDDRASWGVMKEGVIRHGGAKTACTMLLAIRIMYYLGCRRLYLVGVDFNMVHGAEIKANYAFGERRDTGAIRSNNSQYQVAATWLQAMSDNGTFSRFGFEVYNCNPKTSLKAFPVKSFEEAMKDCLTDFPEEPFDLERWYEKGKK